MIRIIDLQTALLDLLYELRDTGEKLIVGGGYGIYLKMDHLSVPWPAPSALE